MAIISNKDFHDFLLTSKKFSRQVDKYVLELGLDKEEIERYKDDNRMLAAISIPEYADDAWDGKWMHNKIENLHVALSHLIQVCKNSKNYSVEIGMELGIESPMQMVAVAVSGQ